MHDFFKVIAFSLLVVILVFSLNFEEIQVKDFLQSGVLVFVKLKDLLNWSLRHYFDFIFDTGSANEVVVSEALFIEYLYDIFQWLATFLHAQSELLLDLIKPIEHFGKARFRSDEFNWLLVRLFTLYVFLWATYAA